MDIRLSGGAIHMKLTSSKQYVNCVKKIFKLQTMDVMLLCNVQQRKYTSKKQDSSTFLGESVSTS